MFEEGWRTEALSEVGRNRDEEHGESELRLMQGEGHKKHASQCRQAQRLLSASSISPAEKSSECWSKEGRPGSKHEETSMTYMTTSEALCY